ncbi:MAG TPA: flagellar hook-basal body complex protein FliE [Bryobacteraceae bacterium]|nr:flagellar hook-basal body complex protein FliE [Bryobacteraceae bacterium]
MPISSISTLLSSSGPQLSSSSAQPTSAAGSGEFRSALEGAIQAVERPRQDAAQAVQAFLSGESEELHTAALATERAEMALEFGLQVRSKVVQAYQEIMRMPM